MHRLLLALLLAALALAPRSDAAVIFLRQTGFNLCAGSLNLDWTTCDLISYAVLHP